MKKLCYDDLHFLGLLVSHWLPFKPETITGVTCGPSRRRAGHQKQGHRGRRHPFRRPSVPYGLHGLRAGTARPYNELRVFALRCQLLTSCVHVEVAVTRWRALIGVHHNSTFQCFTSYLGRLGG